MRSQTIDDRIPGAPTSAIAMNQEQRLVLAAFDNVQFHDMRLQAAPEAIQNVWDSEAVKKMLLVCCHASKKSRHHIQHRSFNRGCCGCRFFHWEKMGAVEHHDAAFAHFFSQRHAYLLHFL